MFEDMYNGTIYEDEDRAREVAKEEMDLETYLDLVIDIKHFFHAIRHHYKECGFKKLAKAFFRIWKKIFKCIGIGLLILIKIILYPIYLLLDLLYN